jgi:endo-1,4-beta-D-glucanase Y
MDRGWVPDGSRRRLLKAGIGLAALSLCSTAAAADQNWQTFKRRFVVDDRRVIDSGNNNVSHSESQGWGLLFAQSYDDKETFAKIWDWTSKSLQRGDGLFSWRWSPNTNDPVPDKNNAADGDILIAWALARAAAKWNEPRWLQPSRRIQSAVLDRLAVEFQGRLILLPGAQGFARGNRYVVNLSYYVWPAIHDFAEHAGDQGRWRRLEADGLWLLDNAAFGDYRLPPDWLLFGNQAFRVADDWKPYFGFDAIRIPLYLAWHNQASRLGRFVTAWRTPRFGGRPPAWINLDNGAVAPFPSSGGYAAVAAVTQFVADGAKGAAPVAAIGDDDDYYSASLKLLANLAGQEAPRAKRT